MRLSIHIEKIFPTGAYKCTAMYRDRLVQHRYMGYTKREAIAEFRDYLKGLAR